MLSDAWGVFSIFFTEHAEGDHAYVAVNDAMPDDWFIKYELPVMKGKFTKITTIEPTISSDGSLAIKETGWQFDEWLNAQQAQWEKPFHYLDGTQYPTALIIP